MRNKTLPHTKEASPALTKALYQFEKNMLEQMKEAEENPQNQKVMDTMPSGAFHL